jgi:hypothetical protein
MAAALLDPARVGLPDPRFAVHRNNVVAGLIGALAETYPAVERLVGPDFFRAAAGVFLRAHPPASPVLLRWGGAFGDWLERFPPAARLPWLADVARLEWARAEAFHAADAAPLSIAALAAVPADWLDGVRLTLHPSLRLVPSRFPVASLWADVTGPRTGGVDLGRAETALVARPFDGVEVSTPGPAAAAFLSALAAGRPLGGAAAEGAAHAGFDLAAQIAALFAAGLVVRVAA